MDAHPSSIDFFPEHCIFPKSGYATTDGSIALESKHMQVRVHRLSYRLFKGDIPPDMCVVQSCHNKSCINPKHLTLENQADKTAKTLSTRRQDLGVDRPNAKLNDEKVRHIRASGMTVTALAKLHSVSRKCIGQVLKGKIWKHVKAKESGNV
jgi:hypothetical protein